MPKKKTPTIDLERLHRSDLFINSYEAAKSVGYVETESDRVAFSKFLAERKDIRK